MNCLRSCLVQLLILVALVLGLAWFGLPAGAGWVATNALGAAGFKGTDTKVEVSSSPPLLLLVGRADSIHLTSNEVTVGGLSASTLDLTLGHVELISRTIETVKGTLTGVSLVAPNGDPVTVDTVALNGSATVTQAQLKLSLAEFPALAVSQLASQGVTATVTLAPPNKITVKALGASQAGQLVPRNGGLVLVPSGGSLPEVEIIAPGTGNPFSVTSVKVAADGVTISGTIDLQTLLGL